MITSPDVRSSIVAKISSNVVLVLGVEDETLGGHLLYIHISSFFFAVLYTVTGYFYQKKFYRQLTEAVNSPHGEIGALLPEAKNEQQKLFLDLVKKMERIHREELQTLYDEKREHQENKPNLNVLFCKDISNPPQCEYTFDLIII